MEQTQSTSAPYYCSEPWGELIKVGNNNNNDDNKDYLCHHSYANNSNGDSREASGRNKYPPAFISPKTVGTGLFLFSLLCFSEEWSVSGGGGWREFGTGEVWG